MSKVLHIGVVGVFSPDAERLPDGVTSDGDSFLEWGESWRGQAEPIHLLVDLDAIPYDPTDASDQRTGRAVLNSLLRNGERLTDYMVVTDRNDWSEDVTVVLLDGTSVKG